MGSSVVLLFQSFIILYRNILQDIFFCVPLKKESQLLDWYDGEQMLNSGWTIP